MSLAALSCSLRALSLGTQRPVKACRNPISSVPLHTSLSARRNGICSSQLITLRSPSSKVQRIQAVGPVCKLKLKTRKAAAKRYKVTGSGKVLTRRPGKQHINEKKGPKRLRNLGRTKQVANGDMRKVKKCLPYAGL